MSVLAPATILSKQFWVNLATVGAGVFATSFAGYLTATTSTPSVHSVEAAAWSAGAAAVAVVLHSFGVTAQAKAAAAKTPAAPAP